MKAQTSNDTDAPISGGFENIGRIFTLYDNGRYALSVFDSYHDVKVYHYSAGRFEQVAFVSLKAMQKLPDLRKELSDIPGGLYIVYCHGKSKIFYCRPAAVLTLRFF